MEINQCWNGPKILPMYLMIVSVQGFASHRKDKGDKYSIEYHLLPDASFVFSLYCIVFLVYYVYCLYSLWYVLSLYYVLLYGIENILLEDVKIHSCWCVHTSLLPFRRTFLWILEKAASPLSSWGVKWAQLHFVDEWWARELAQDPRVPLHLGTGSPCRGERWNIFVPPNVPPPLAK